MATGLNVNTIPLTRAQLTCQLKKSLKRQERYFKVASNGLMKSPRSGFHKMVKLSVVIPTYNEESILPELYRRLTKVLENIGESYEVIYVNDGSTDKSLDIMKTFHSKNKRIKVLDLSRNFGHQIAITAGCDYARGEAVIVMDADLQDPPEVIPQLIKTWREGYDVVFAVREKREGERYFKQVTASLFYRLIRKITEVEIPKDTGDFRLMSRRVVDGLKSTREKHCFVRGLVSWIGFNQTGVKFIREARYAGETKYSYKKLFKLALDGITSFSFIPLQLGMWAGLVVSLFSFLYALYAILMKILTHVIVPGWTSLMVAILFLGGVQLFTLGLIGEYIGRIYDQVKQRPLYFVKEFICEEE